jgi:hypothetical protein
MMSVCNDFFYDTNLTSNLVLFSSRNQILLQLNNFFKKINLFTSKILLKKILKNKLKKPIFVSFKIYFFFKSFLFSIFFSSNFSIIYNVCVCVFHHLNNLFFFNSTPLATHPARAHSHFIVCIIITFFFLLSTSGLHVCNDSER